MSQRITIDPVSRIEGHAKITLHLDDAGRVAEARLHITEFRGFEQFCVGRPLWEMAGITARICGICPVSHVLASARAGDQILAVDVPPAAQKLRRLMNLAQIVQSHALSFFHLSAPDLLLGMDADPARRNILGLAAAEPELARGGIRLRQLGQQIIEALGGRKVHPAWAVPGGVRSALAPEPRDAARARLPEARATALAAIERFKGLIGNYRDEARAFGDFPSLFMALVAPDGSWEHHDGSLRFVDEAGRIVADIPPQRYQELIAEQSEPWSYMKFPYFRPRGYPAGIYRVGPLARLNVCSHMGTPLADAELRLFRELGAGAVTSSFFYHYARLIEILAALERIELLLDDPDISGAGSMIRARSEVNRLEGVGVSEAPRGTLFHHYTVDEHGLIKSLNLVIASGQNNLAMNKTVAQIAQGCIMKGYISEGALNRIEAGVRAYDPCLSCATHALGEMPMVVTLLGSDGAVLDEVSR
ncbi:MAG: hypothetical protein RLZZ387_1978 [Chloroflexota bacterium]|jgi:NAD-reducing hydrogenase large subunit